MNIKDISSRCSGCSACENTCYKKAITMEYSPDGFFYPVVDEILCSDCGACYRICPVVNTPKASCEYIKAYAGYANDPDIVKRSSSGGAFTLMANYILAQGGLVIGASYDTESKEVIYNSTDNVSLDELRRSKYVSPNPNGVFEAVKEALDKSRMVLFCGLPCHIAGLRNYIGNSNDKLILCDFICGGVPSALFFKEHLNYLESKYKGTVTSVNFRPKLFGWKQHSIKIDFDNGKSIGCYPKCDSYFSGYFGKYFQRDCCYECAYRVKHYSDIIIADYWGGILKGDGNDTGVSLLISNTIQGNRFFEKISKTNQGVFSEIHYDDIKYAFTENKELQALNKKKKDSFMNAYSAKGFEKAARAIYHKGIFIFLLKKSLRKRLNFFHRKNK